MHPTTEHLGPACSDKTRADLEWDRLLSAIAARTAGPLGARAALALPFYPSFALARAALDEVHEAIVLRSLDTPMPTSGCAEVTDILSRLRAGAVLAPTELLSVNKILVASRSLRRFLRSHRERVPSLARVCDTDPALDPIADEISRCIEPDGTISDHASPKLRALRSERQIVRERLLHKLDDFMRQYAPALQDEYYTEREGRFVLPVKSDSHERFQGIVHGTSASGQTLFMEPRAIVPHGNKLKVVDADIEREERAVCASLSSLLSDNIEGVRNAEAALAHAELRDACARLAVDLDLQFPELIQETSLDLIQARHPLLVLDGVAVVASDAQVQAGSALILSGPNAGGKTVVLKTLGMCVLMLRAGLPLPCDAKSRVGFFTYVASDMGDDQSMSANLSTFSAHVRNLAAILDQASNGTLVLLDEVATGTDPRQGEALATGVLDGLCARRAAIACTTHYEGLKTLALGDSRFVNASVGFDIDTMSPTFKLLMGIPGASSALAIARRFGLPSLVIERAERYLGADEQGVDELIRKLNDERRALELAQVAAQREAATLRRQREAVDQQLEQLRARGRAKVSEESQALLGELRRARADLREVRIRLKGKKVSLDDLKQATSHVDAVAKKVAIGGSLSAPAHDAPVAATTQMSWEELRTGSKALVPRLGIEVEIVERLPGQQLRVQAGSVRMTVTANELRPTLVRRPETKPRTASPAKEAAHDLIAPLQTSENTCDLRGLRVHEAEAMTEQFLDRSLNLGHRVAFLIHGHGTGALRSSLRQLLASSAYVAHSRPAEPSQGGDGVTVVWLK